VSARHAAASRRGFTLAELLVTLVLLGILMGAIIGVLARQQQFYSSATDLMDTRGRVRQALAVLPSDLRALSPSDTLSGGANKGDIYLWNDHVLEFRSVTGSSVVCWLPAVAPVTTLRLPPVGLPNVLTSWQRTPVVGDSLLLFDNMSGQATASRWRAYAVTAVGAAAGAGGCPTGAGQFLTAAQGALPSYGVTVTPALTATIAVGAPVRVFRRVHYELYQETDGRWYLGFFDCLSTYPGASQCGALEPVSGPYQAYSATPGQSGLQFTYYDSTGAVLNPSTAKASTVARIEFTVRAQTQAAISLSGGGRAVARDTTRYTIGLRNRH
jgi:prepilin-type N-terminal cleavage/methylation domain-containing protein